MIASIKGKITLKTEKFIVIETNNIGYKVSVSPDALSKLNKKTDEVYLWIHSHIREDAFDLYGFIDREELEFFELLLNVSGIGPKSALGILSITTIDTLRHAIATGETSYLTKISGIGRKTAEKIVIELRDKIKVEKVGASLQGELDTMEALKSLGYGQNEIREAMKNISSQLNTNQRIKEALKVLGGK